MIESTTATVCNEESEYVIVEGLRIRKEVYCIKEEVVANRRSFHKEPELSFKEFKTTMKIAELLTKYGIDEVYHQIHEVPEVKGWTGVIALIKGAQPGPCVALRADIDALPIKEAEDTLKDGYISEVEGVMHACGHDGHTAGLLAAARVLNGMKEKFYGVIKLIFQPAEEEGGGANVLIDKYDCLGLREDSKYGPKVDYIFGLHIVTAFDLGVVSYREGPMMAGSDQFNITVKGKGGHGSTPQGTIDAIVTAAHLITALQTIPSRNLDPLKSAVISCGTIHGGYARNVIADKVEIEGTVRYFEDEVKELIKERIGTICTGIATSFGDSSIDLHYKDDYPVTENKDVSSLEAVEKAAMKIVGKENKPPPKVMNSEDFSYYLKQCKGAREK